MGGGRQVVAETNRAIIFEAFRMFISQECRGAMAGAGARKTCRQPASGAVNISFEKDMQGQSLPHPRGEGVGVWLWEAAGMEPRHGLRFRARQEKHR